MDQFWIIDNCSTVFPEIFRGTPSEIWSWLEDYGPRCGFGTLQCVTSGQTDELWPWSPRGDYSQPLYGIRVRYDTTFERHTGCTLLMLFYPEDANPDAVDFSVPWGRNRRARLLREHEIRSRGLDKIPSRFLYD